MSGLATPSSFFSHFRYSTRRTRVRLAAPRHSHSYLSFLLLDGDGFFVLNQEYRIAEIDSPEKDQVDYNDELVTGKNKIIAHSVTKLLCRQVGVSHKRIVVQVWTTSLGDDQRIVFKSLAKTLLQKGGGRYAPLRLNKRGDWRDTEQPESDMRALEAKAEKDKVGMFDSRHDHAPTLQEIEDFRANKRKTASAHMAE